MGKKSHGPRRKTRNKLKKKVREKGLFPSTRLLIRYNMDDKAVIMIDPSVHEGMPHPRFHGKVGLIIGKRGQSYLLKVKDGGKEKIVIAKPEHLKPFT